MINIKPQPNIYEKLFKIQQMNLTLTKNAKNPFFNSSYLTLDELNKKLNPILNDLKLLVIHRTSKRNVITEVIDIENLDYVNSTVKSSFAIPETITDPQKMGSAITYAKRYNLVQLFNIVADEDDDGNATKQTKQNDVEEIAL